MKVLLLAVSMLFLFPSHAYSEKLFVGGTVSYPKAGYPIIWSMTWNQPSREAARAAVIKDCHNRGGYRCEVSATTDEGPCVGAMSEVLRRTGREDYWILYGTEEDIRNYRTGLVGSGSDAVIKKLLTVKCLGR